jgi:transcriptional regulator with XRE-family HTH domain
MDKLGERLRERARDLGLTDSEVARRLDLDQRRYQHYVVGRSAPNFSTFIRICRALATTPSALLGFEDLPKIDDERAGLVARIDAAADALDLSSLRTAADVMDAIAKNSRRHGGDPP